MSNRLYENANKVTYLVHAYPEHSIAQIAAFFEALPFVETNTAFWYAASQGWITPIDKEAKKTTFLKAPDTWDFGDEITNLEQLVVYGMQEMAKIEADLSEQYLLNWVNGYANFEQIIALKHLVESKQLATYKLTDPEDEKSVYTIYSLYENKDKLWGKKQFKVQPEGVTPEDSEVKNEGGELTTPKGDGEVAVSENPNEQ